MAAEIWRPRLAGRPIIYKLMLRNVSAIPLQRGEFAVIESHLLRNMSYKYWFNMN